MIHEIVGAGRDLNARTNEGKEYFRKVWRGGQWQWFSERLPREAFLASDRRAKTYGPVETGEIVVEFDRRVGYGGSQQCAIEGFYRIDDDPSDARTPFKFTLLAHQRNSLTTYFLTGEGQIPVTVTDPLAHGMGSAT